MWVAKTLASFLVDSVGVQADVKVQVNNANSIDPHKAHHAVHPQALANESQLNVLINRGAIGPFDDPLKESSASAGDFAANWVDMPGGDRLTILFLHM